MLRPSYQVHSVPLFIFHLEKKYYVASSIAIPLQITDMSYIDFEGYGATLYTDQAISILKRTMPDQSSANTYVSSRIMVSGLTFKGNNTAGQKAIDIGATYGSVFKDLYIEYFDTGFDCQFCLMGSLQNSLFLSNSTDSVVIRSGSGVCLVPLYLIPQAIISRLMP